MNRKNKGFLIIFYFLTLTLMGYVLTPLALAVGSDPPSEVYTTVGSTQASRETAIGNFFTYSISGFIPKGSSSTLAGSNGYFSLSSYGMPDIRAVKKGILYTDEESLGQRWVSYRKSDGTIEQVSVWVKSYEVCMSISFETDCPKTYIPTTSYTQKVHYLRVGYWCWANRYHKDYFFNIPQMSPGSSQKFHEIGDRVAEGDLVISMQLNPQIAFPQTIASSDGQYNFLEYWAGITEVMVDEGNVAITNDYKITSSDTEIQLSGDTPSFPGSASGSWTDTSGLQSNDRAGYVGIVAGKELHINESIGYSSYHEAIYTSPEIYLPNTQSQVDITGTGYTSDMVGLDQLQGEFYLHYKLSPEISWYSRTHKYDYANDLWNCLGRCASDGTAGNTIEQSCGVTVENTRINQNIKATIMIASYYDFNLYTPDRDFNETDLLKQDDNVNTNDNVWDGSVYGSGQYWAEIVIPELLDTFLTIIMSIIILIIVVAVVIVAIYVFLRFFRRRGSKKYPQGYYGYPYPPPPPPPEKTPAQRMAQTEKYLESLLVGGSSEEVAAGIGEFTFATLQEEQTRGKKPQKQDVRKALKTLLDALGEE